MLLSTAEVLLIVMGIPVLLYLARLSRRRFNRQHDLRAAEGLLKLKSYLGSLESDNSDYRFFTIGHIVWSEIEIAEVIQMIRDACVKSTIHSGEGSIDFTVKPKFLLHCDESSKRVYIVFTEDKTFDWDSIPHYEDYVRSNR